MQRERDEPSTTEVVVVVSSAAAAATTTATATAISDKSKKSGEAAVAAAATANSSPAKSETDTYSDTHRRYMSDSSESEEDSVSEEFEEDPQVESDKFLLSGDDERTVDPETQARLEALLQAAGIGKLAAKDGKHLGDPEVLRRLTSSVSCALDEAAAALTRMRTDTRPPPDKISLVDACTDGDVGTVRKLLTEGRSVHETSEEGESLLSLACSAGYFELAQVLLAMHANVEDRGIKGECTPLMEAASAGHLDIVRLLVAHGADVNAQSTSGNTPLMYGCAGGHTEVVKFLLENGANVEDHNENGHTPLMEAASAGHVDLARILLRHGAGINTHSNEFKESALTLACYKGHLDMVRFLLEAGADQEHKTDEMHTALMEASMDGHVEVARLLLDSGAQVNMPTDSFESPLTLAACGGHVDLAMLLIERGANIEEVNDEGYTPLMEAAREGHEEMVHLLLGQGANINAQTDETQETALTLACCGGFTEVADILLKGGADIELGASTPLMEAAQEGHIDLVRFLLEHGANVHAQTQTGDTALTYACENGHTDVADLLLQYDADLEHESEGGRTPLMKACRAGHVCTVQFLIVRGANVNRQTTNNDHTPLSLACAGGHIQVVELLLTNGANPNHKLKDNSTMIIEASKGGHTAVVQMLLDFPHSLQPIVLPQNQLNANAGGASANNSGSSSKSSSIASLATTAAAAVSSATNATSATNLSMLPGQVAAATGGNANVVARDGNLTAAQQQQQQQGQNVNFFPSTTGSTFAANTTSCGSSSILLHEVPDAVRIHPQQQQQQQQKTQSQQQQPAPQSGSGDIPNFTDAEIFEKLQRSTMLLKICDENGSDLEAAAAAAVAATAAATAKDMLLDDVVDSELLAAMASATNATLNSTRNSNSNSNSSNPVSSNSGSNTASSSNNAAAASVANRPKIQLTRKKKSASATATAAPPVLINSNADEGTTQKQQILEELHRVERELQGKQQQLLLQQSAGNNANYSVVLPVINDQGVTSSCSIADGSAIATQTATTTCLQQQQQQSQSQQQQQQQNLLQQTPSTTATTTTTTTTNNSAITNTPFKLTLYNTAPPDSQQQQQQQQLQQQQVQVQAPPNLLANLNQQTNPANNSNNGGRTAMVFPKVAASEAASAASTTPAFYFTPSSTGATVSLTTANQQPPCSGGGASNQQQQQPIKFQSVASHTEVSQSTAISDRPKAKPVSKKEGKNARKQLHPQQNKQQLLPSIYNEPFGSILQQHHHQQQQQMQNLNQPQTQPQQPQTQPQPQPNAKINLQQQQNNQQQQQQQLQTVAAAPSVATIPPATAATFTEQEIMKGLELETLEQARFVLKNDSHDSLLTASILQQFHSPIRAFIGSPVAGEAQKLGKLDLEQEFGNVSDVVQTMTLEQFAGGDAVDQQDNLEDSFLASLADVEQQTQPQTAIPDASNVPNIYHYEYLAATGQMLPNQQEKMYQAAFQAGFNLSMQHLNCPDANGDKNGAVAPPAVIATTQAATQTQHTELKAQPSDASIASKKAKTVIVPSSTTTTAAAAAATVTESTNNGVKFKKGRILRHQNQNVAAPFPNNYQIDHNAAITQYNSGNNQQVAQAAQTAAQAPIIPPCLDVDSETESNRDTALTLACAGGHDDLVELLISRGANIEHRDKKGFTPLILAATAGHEKVVEILLNHNAEIEAQSERTKDTPLSLACSGGRYEVVELLLNRQANKEHRNVSDYTPLSLAASGGYVNIIKLLLSHGAEINSRTGSKLGISPLMLAAMNGHTAAVKLLLDMGSDINAQIETNRNTALTLACFQGRHEVVSLLLDRKANVEHRAKTGLTPLMEAASGGYVEVGRVLLDKGADVNATPVPSSRDTALTIAADKGHVRFVELLLQRGAQVEVKNKKGNSPVWLAANGGHLPVVEILYHIGANIDSQDNRKVSCLMAAFRKGHVKVVKWMVHRVTQFPSDQEMIRYISTVSDKDLLEKCHECVKIIRAAKETQAAKANRNASILLEELDMEKTREESKRLAAAKKRERKKKKKLEKKEERRKLLEENKKNENYDEESGNSANASAATVKSAPVGSKKGAGAEEGVVEAAPSQQPNNADKEEGDSGIDANSQGSCSSNDLKQKEKRKEKKKKKNTSSSAAAKSAASSSASKKDDDKSKKWKEPPAPVVVKSPAERDDFQATGNDYTKPAPSKNSASTNSSTNTSKKEEASPNGKSPKSNSQKQRGDEGWKEVVRKSSVQVCLETNLSSIVPAGPVQGTTKKVSVPLNAISRVIGRGGSNINAIRGATGAHIEVEKQSKGQGERIITIKGTVEATKQAHSLIATLIKDPDMDIVQMLTKSTVVKSQAPATTSLWDKTQIGTKKNVRVMSVQQPAAAASNSAVKSTSSASIAKAAPATAPLAAKNADKAAPASGRSSQSTAPRLNQSTGKFSGQSAPPVKLFNQSKPPASYGATFAAKLSAEGAAAKKPFTNASKPAQGANAPVSPQQPQPALYHQQSPSKTSRPAPTASAPPTMQHFSAVSPGKAPTTVNIQQMTSVAAAPPPQQPPPPTTSTAATSYFDGVRNNVNSPSLALDEHKAAAPPAYTLFSDASGWTRTRDTESHLNFAAVTGGNNSGSNANSTKFIEEPPAPQVDASKAPGYRGRSGAVCSPVSNKSADTATPPSLQCDIGPILRPQAAAAQSNAQTDYYMDHLLKTSAANLNMNDLNYYGAPAVAIMSRLNPKAPDFAAPVSQPGAAAAYKTSTFNGYNAPSASVAPPTSQQQPPANMYNQNTAKMRQHVQSRFAQPPPPPPPTNNDILPNDLFSGLAGLSFQNLAKVAAAAASTSAGSIDIDLVFGGGGGAGSSPCNMSPNFAHDMPPMGGAHFEKAPSMPPPPPQPIGTERARKVGGYGGEAQQGPPPNWASVKVGDGYRFSANNQFMGRTANDVAAAMAATAASTNPIYGDELQPDYYDYSDAAVGNFSMPPQMYGQHQLPMTNFPPTDYIGGPIDQLNWDTRTNLNNLQEKQHGWTNKWTQ